MNVVTFTFSAEYAKQKAFLNENIYQQQQTDSKIYSYMKIIDINVKYILLFIVKICC